MATLRYAVGDYLDIYGENRGCYRIQAAAAQAQVQISFAATGTVTTFEAGTALTADGDMLWRLKNDVVHSGAQQTLTADIVAAKEGAAGNTLASGTSMQLMTGNAAVLSVTCTTAASGGNDEETDDSYRARIQEYGLAAVTTGPKERYEAAAMAVSSRILDARALQTAAGKVGVYLLIGGTDGKQAIVDSVTAALNDKTARPLTDQVTVSQAAQKEYLLQVQYVAPSGTNISAAVSAAVNDYKDWQEGQIGRAFNPDRLTVALYQAGCTRVIYKNTSTFDGGSAVYTEIGADKVCSGTVTIEEINA